MLIKLKVFNLMIKLNLFETIQPIFFNITLRKKKIKATIERTLLQLHSYNLKFGENRLDPVKKWLKTGFDT